MLSTKKVKNLANYWLLSSEEKLKTMKSLYKSKRYADCLFFSHLVLEKVLKALVVRKTKDYAPYTHNLLYLADLADLFLKKEQKKLLAIVNEFNLQARYPDEKLSFYKLCTKSYADKYFKPIISLYKNLCQLPKPKK